MSIVSQLIVVFSSTFLWHFNLNFIFRDEYNYVNASLCDKNLKFGLSHSISVFNLIDRNLIRLVLWKLYKKSRCVLEIYLRHVYIIIEEKL